MNVYKNGYETEGAPEYAMDFFPEDFKGIFVDIGAYHPKIINNSWIFEQKGWETFCVDANPNCISDLKKARRNVYWYAVGEENKDDLEFFVFQTGDGAQEGESAGESSGTGLLFFEHHKNDLDKIIKVNMRTIDWLMENEFKVDHIDILSIDIEGWEVAALIGCDLVKWYPKLIIIENCHKDLSQREFIEAHGYTFMDRHMYNDFYLAFGEVYYPQNSNITREYMIKEHNRYIKMMNTLGKDYLRQY